MRNPGLGNLGADAKAAVPTLVDLLQDDGCRESAAFALGQIGGSDAKAAVPILVSLLADSDEFVQRTVATSLKNLGKDAVPQVIEVLKSKNEQRAMAVNALGEIGPDAKAAVPLLVELLQDDKYRDAAALALGQISGPDAKKAIPSLEKLLGDDDELMRMAAATALGKVGKDAVAPLLRILKQKGDDRIPAVYSLGEIGPDAKAAIPALVSLLDDDDKVVRMTAATAVGKLGKDAVPPLIEYLKDGKAKNALLATYALGEIGYAAKDALPILNSQLQNKGPQGNAKDETKKGCKKRTPRKFVFLNPSLLKVKPFDESIEAYPSTRFAAACAVAKIAKSIRQTRGVTDSNFTKAISVLMEVGKQEERKDGMKDGKGPGKTEQPSQIGLAVRTMSEGLASAGFRKSARLFGVPCEADSAAKTAESAGSINRRTCETLA